MLKKKKKKFALLSHTALELSLKLLYLLHIEQSFVQLVDSHLRELHLQKGFNILYTYINQCVCECFTYKYSREREINQKLVRKVSVLAADGIHLLFTSVLWLLCYNNVA